MNLYEIRSRTYFEISSDSGDYNKFVNALRCSPVQFFGLEIRKNVISGYVRTKDMKRLPDRGSSTAPLQSCRGVQARCDPKP